MSSRSLADLEYETRVRAVKFLASCARAGHRVFITQTLRTSEDQAALYAQGRTRPGKVVTNSKPGHSWHEVGRAFDIAFKTPDNEVTWDGPWEMVGILGESQGLSWGGHWPHPDRPHFEYRNHLTLAQAQEQWEKSRT